MHPAFSHPRYLLKRQVLALTGKVRIFDPAGQMVLYSEQKMFRLREDIRVYEDEAKQRQVLGIHARQILDFSAAYDVSDTLSGMPVGILRRRGWRSMLRDTWEILDSTEAQIGVLQEESQGLALMRRFLLGSLLPQRYDLFVGLGGLAATYRQRFHLFRYEMEIDLKPGCGLDPRLALAAAVLLAIIERKQES